MACSQAKEQEIFFFFFERSEVLIGPVEMAVSKSFMVLDF